MILDSVILLADFKSVTLRTFSQLQMSFREKSLSHSPFSGFLDVPCRRPGNVAPWDWRVIVINEAKMEPRRHDAVAPSENSYLPVSELRVQTSPRCNAMALRDAPGILELPLLVEISRTQAGNMCRGNKREDPDKKARSCAWLCSVTNDRESPSEDGSFMLIQVLPSDYRTVM